MKIDKTAIAGMLAVSAAMLAGCDDRVCVDKQGRRAPVQDCGGHSGGGAGAYYFVSGWRGGGVGSVDGVARGGFGGEAAGHAGGGVGE